MIQPRSPAARRLALAPPPDRRAALAADGVLTIPEAVKFVGLSQSELYRRMKAGTLPFVKLGRRRLIPRRALVELLAANMSVVE